jgi:hypothetical protein
MKPFHLTPGNAAIFALLALAAASAGTRAGAQQHPLPNFVAPPPPAHGGHMHGFHGGVFVIERDVVVDREADRDDRPAAAPVPAAPPPPPRKPWVLGRSYSALPGGCLKLIEDGASYFGCSGEWYRQVGTGSGAQYRAVAKP